jgi:hypothetical protein
MVCSMFLIELWKKTCILIQTISAFTWWGRCMNTCCISMRGSLQPIESSGASRAVRQHDQSYSSIPTTLVLYYLTRSGQATKSESKAAFEIVRGSTQSMFFFHPNKWTLETCRIYFLIPNGGTLRKPAAADTGAVAWHHRPRQLAH